MEPLFTHIQSLKYSSAILNNKYDLLDFDSPQLNILLSFYLLKTFKYEFVNCKPIKNKCVFKKFFIFRTIFVSLFTFKGYNNKYNYNCLFDTIISYSVYNRNCFVHMQLVTRLFELLPTN